ncbi:MAG TPA: ATP-dependent zinc metalloprotease FtsH [Bacteriovoracaceae bacterium]|nr:ATP-dependent zinc metalloprotease FtsH [Bacteriovoracaceae bacterium]
MKKRINLSYFIFALLFILFIRSYFLTQSVSNLTYSEFKGELQKGNIEELTISGDKISGTLTNPLDGKAHFMTTLVEPELAKELDQYNVKYGRIIESTWLTDIISLILPILLFMVIWYFFIRKAFARNLGGGPGGNFMAIGKSKAKIYVETDTKVTFKDVAGADEALEELKEIIDFLKNSEKVKTLGGKMPKGVLLVGPPGTGKTLIAKAVAGEAGVPFFSTNGAEFVEMFVGVGAARVRDLFEQAKKQAPCIIFIDELDALGKVRHQSPMGSNDEKEQTLNQLLVEMDGFDTQSGIIILSATNRPEILDPALLRSGRFDRQVLIDKPDRKGRTDILRIHAKKVNLDPELDLEKIASLTPGFSGADLANLVNEAALVATRESASSINLHHFTKAIERMVAGLEKKNRLLNDFERKVVAHHEMGHALMGMLFNQDEAIHKVSIIPRGIGSLGYTIQRPTEDRYLMTKQELENKMTVLMGGRAAENLIFSHFSTGAADDMAKATSIAREMVLRYGMSDELGHVSYEEGPNFLGDRSSQYMSSKYSSETANLIDKIVKDLVGAAFERAFKTLKENESLLRQSASELLEKETLTEDELKPYFDQIKKNKLS